MLWQPVIEGALGVTGQITSAFDHGDEEQAVAAARVAEANARSLEAANAGTITGTINANPLTFAALALGVVAVLAWAVRR